MNDKYKDIKDIAKELRAQLKKEFPACKFSVTIERFSMGQAMKVALMAAPFPVSSDPEFNGYAQLNHYTIAQPFPKDGNNNGKALTQRTWHVLQRAQELGNKDNWNNSDAMTDYFDVNYYFDLHIGKWDKPFEQTGDESGEAEETAVPEPAEQAGDVQNTLAFTVTHQGTWTWVEFDAKPDREVLDAIGRDGLGFGWSKRRAAWYAKELVEEATIRQAIAGAVVEEEGGTAVPPSTSPEPQAPPQPERRGDPVLAAKLRVYADGLDKTIEKKRSTFAGANVTRRRAGMIAQANKEADELVKVQQVLLALADLHDAGDVPDFLTEVKHKKTAVTLVEDVDRLKYRESRNDPDYKLWGYGDVERYFAGYDAYLQAVNWGRDVVDNNHDPEAAQRNKLRQMINEAKLAGIPGYFATPEDVQDGYLFNNLDLQPGDLVLEPSAGDGRLADGLVKRFPGIELHCGEISYTLRKILQVKGYTLVSDDFLEYAPGEVYDAIVMNPPFENQQDIDHIRHAFSLLKPGGTLVSVTSRGWTFRSDAKATAFREFVDEHGWGDNLPDGSFDSEGTGVATSYVMLTK